MLAIIIGVLSLNIAEKATAAPITLVALGDSLVHGYGLVPEQGFVAQMQTALATRGYEAKVINAGVSGDTTAGGAARAAWTMTDDVQALILALGGNDVLRGLAPSEARQNLQSILTVAQAKNIPVLLVGISAPFNYGEEYKQEFEAIYPDLSQEFGTVLYPNFLQALTDMPDRTAMMQKYMQADALHPNADGVALIVKDMEPFVVQLIEQVEKQP